MAEVNQNKKTNWGVLTQGEGDIIAYMYSVVSPTGDILKSNVPGSFVVDKVKDAELQAHIDAIKTYIDNRLNPTI